MRKTTVTVENIKVTIRDIDSHKYISLTDIAKKRNPEEPRFVVINWLRNRNTIEFLGIWESMHNSDFNRVEFDTVIRQSGLNSFSLSPSKWIEETNAKGIITKSGRYSGGTYAHEDIALEFASWISPEFKLYFIKEFRRLKNEESKKLQISWDVKRELVKINYKIHTDAIKENLLPPKITATEAKKVYATEADILNKALFGSTAKEWSNKNPETKGNMRDYADIRQLVVLANLESLNAEYIKENVSAEKRVIKLNTVAISQMKSLLNNKNIKKLEDKKRDI
ncbi:MAG: KilA-N domain-containing protein [Candidatus Woesearchaeota archaeon]